MSDVTMLAEAEAFYETNKAEVDAIVAELGSASVEDHALDEVVHEMADDANIDSEEASSLNNQGLAYQVASILQGFGKAEGLDRIRAETGTKPHP